MDFEACSKCSYGQSDDTCDIHNIYVSYNENELNEILFRHGLDCDFYADSTEITPE